MNLYPFLVDIQTLLETNSAGVRVYREESVPESGDLATGYIAWDLSVEKYDKCSGDYTGQIFGDLEIILYADTRSIVSTLIDSMLDLLAPTSSGERDEIAPTALTSTFLHYCTLTDSDEVFPEKTGHNTKDTVGISYTFQIKASI